MFNPSRPLLYPQFETYRLHSLSPDDDVKSYPLPGEGATQSRLGYGEHALSFKEVRARISWDHLCVNDQGKLGVYVDKEWNVVAFQLNEDLSPSISVIESLPTPIGSSSDTPEYPSVVHLIGDKWAISTGSGQLYILQITTSDSSSSDSSSSNQLSGKFTARYEFNPSGSSSASPFLIQAKHAKSAEDVRVLIQRTVNPPTNIEKGVKRQKRESIKFELSEISINPSSLLGTGSNGFESLKVLWSEPGGDSPFHCTWSDRHWVILCSEKFGDEVKSKVGESVVETPAQKLARQKEEKRSRLGLGADESGEEDDWETPADQEIPEDIKVEQDPPEEEEDEVKAFKWTQTGDSANIQFMFPPGTHRSHLTIKLSSSDLHLSIKSSDVTIPPQLAQFLQNHEHSFFFPIDPDLSSFTFDPSTSTLDIDLSKADSPNRWPSLFLPNDNEEITDIDIPETISPSTLNAIKASFQEIRSRREEEPEGNHPAMPSLIREELDFEMDEEEDTEGGNVVLGDQAGKIGRDCFVGMVNEKGKSSWSKGSTSVISLPFQGQTSMGEEDVGEGGLGLSMVIKSAVDGLLYTAPSKGEEVVKKNWTHQATIPALSFVLSSKKDIRLIRHLTFPYNISLPSDVSAGSSRSAKKQTEGASTSEGMKTVVMAFDSGSSSAGQGNCYIYYPPMSQTEAKQGVVRISGTDRGAVLGVACMRPLGAAKTNGEKVGEEGSEVVKKVVVVLCEKVLVVLSGVLEP